jgi:hypothetical protein
LRARNSNHLTPLLVHRVRHTRLRLNARHYSPRLQTQQRTRRLWAESEIEIKKQEAASLGGLLSRYWQ